MKRLNLSTWSLLHHQMVRYLLVVVVLIGAWAYLRLGQAEDPAFTWRSVIVRAYWPGASARDVEQQVTKVLEKKLQETEHLDFVDSESRPGETLIFVTLAENTPHKEIAEIFYQVRKKIGDIKTQLPEGVIGPFFDDEWGDTYGSVYALTGEGYTYAQLRDYADRLRVELLRLSQVGKVNVVGAQAERVTIEFDNEKLYTAGVDPLVIIDTLQKQNAIPAPASVDASGDNVIARVTGDFRSVEAIRDLTINAGGRSFRLGDVTRVVRGYQDPAVYRMRALGQQAVGLEVAMRAQGDILQLGRELDGAVAQARANLPVGMELHQIADQPSVVRDAVHIFMRSLVEALVIVLAVSFVSLGKRAGLVVALCIPLVLAITFAGMVGFNIDLQRISLGALIIALGLLVDDAMIVVESMSVRLDRGWHGLKAAAHAYGATAAPMLTGTLITAAGFMPVGLARSDAGEYTFSLFAVVTLALVASWLVAVFFTPYLGFLLLRARPKEQQHDLYRKPVYRAFRRVVAWCVDHRYKVIVGTFAIFVASLGGLAFVKQQFFPLSERTEIIVDVWLPAGSSFAATEHEVLRLEARLGHDARVRTYSSYIGGGPPHFFLAMLPEQNFKNYAAVVISAQDVDARDALYEDVKRWLADDFPLVRGRAYRFESGPPVGYPVQFRLLGDDPAVMRGIADRMAEVVRAHPDTRDVYNDWNEIVKTVRLEVDQDKARALGVSTQDIGQAVSAMLVGLPVTQYRERDRLIEVMVRASGGGNWSLAALGDLPIRTASGKPVPLGQLVTARYGFEDGRIGRRNGRNMINVRADIRDGVQAPEVSQQIEPRLREIIASLPPGYRIETGGVLEAVQRSQQSLVTVVPLMVLVIVTLLMLQLRSLKSAVRVLISAPLGVVGVVVSLLVFQQPFGFVAMLGAIALAGIIMRNSVILVEQIERFIVQARDPRRAIIEAAVRRLRPIVLTAAATILAMIPLTQAAFWKPMAVSMMGGVLIATLLTLVFEPAMYAAWFGVARGAAPTPRAPAAAAARTSAAASVDELGHALLANAARGHLDGVQRALHAGAPADFLGPNQETALMFAARFGHFAVCRALLAAGAQPARRNAAGATAADHAAARGHADLAQILQTQ